MILRTFNRLFIFIVIVLVWQSLTSKPPAPSVPETPEERIPTARYVCREFVKERLNDPKSAEFDQTSSFPTSVENNTYTVLVSGRARNGFNALRRVTFECEVLYMEKDGWIPVSIKQMMY